MAQASEVRLRAMERKDWAEVADLIYVSTNYWYETHGRPAIFRGGPSATMLFCEVYESLDPGCCVVAESTATGRLMGSCFYHPRETHVSLGIMNVHPNYFGKGVARALLNFIIDFADREKKPLRLVSSALNLDSFSLYTRAGFVPRCAFQDMFLEVPKSGLSATNALSSRVRPATLDDVEKMAAIELAISGISRRKDYRHFIENAAGIWHVSVLENDSHALDGFCVSIAHPGSNIVGPGVARTEDGAAALLLAELNQNRGRTPVFLVPVHCEKLVQFAYGLGAKNCEMHFAQVRGAFTNFNGVVLPSFMPETA